VICSGLTAHLLRVAATFRLCSQHFTVKLWLPQMLPNFGYGRQIMLTDVKKQGLPQISANRPNIGSTGKVHGIASQVPFSQSQVKFNWGVSQVSPPKTMKSKAHRKQPPVKVIEYQLR
jgi:hypothetical protein